MYLHYFNYLSFNTMLLMLLSLDHNLMTKIMHILKKGKSEM